MSKLSDAYRKLADVLDAETGQTMADTLDRRMAGDVTNRKTFTRETVYLAELIGRGAPMLDGLSFERRRIMGPIMLRMQTHCKVLFSTLGPNASFLTVQEGTAISGALMLTDCTFKECFFDTISIVGTPVDTNQMLPGFDRMELTEWKQRMGV